MSQDIDQIIPVTVNIKRSGLGPVSFGVALGTYADATDPKDQVAGFFTDPSELAKRHPTRTELQAVANAWFANGGAAFMTYGYDETPAKASPAPQNEAPKVAVEPSPEKTRMDNLVSRLSAINTNSSPKTFIAALNAAADIGWFYFPFPTQMKVPLTADEVKLASDWCEANTRFLMWTVDDASALESANTSDIGSVLHVAGNRRCAVCYSVIDKNLGAKVAGMISTTDFFAFNSYKDAEYKSVTQGPDDLSSSQIQVLKAKGYFFNTDIASKASKTGAMLQNTRSTSQYGETISEVIATDSYLINLQTALLNVVTSQLNLPQTPDGQHLAISAADSLGERYIDNGFLGQREVVHPITKEKIVSRGYITTTVPEDVFKLTDAERGDHKLYPITQYLYRVGSAWGVAATVNVW